MKASIWKFFAILQGLTWLIHSSRLLAVCLFSCSTLSIAPKNQIMIKQLLISKQQHSNTQSPQTLCDRHTRLKKIETKKKLKKKIKQVPEFEHLKSLYFFEILVWDEHFYQFNVNKHISVLIIIDYTHFSLIKWKCFQRLTIEVKFSKDKFTIACDKGTWCVAIILGCKGKD